MIRYDTILYYTIPYHTILYYTILYYTILYYTILSILPMYLSIHLSIYLSPDLLCVDPLSFPLLILSALPI